MADGFYVLSGIDGHRNVLAIETAIGGVRRAGQALSELHLGVGDANRILSSLRLRLLNSAPGEHHR